MSPKEKRPLESQDPDGSAKPFTPVQFRAWPPPHFQGYSGNIGTSRRRHGGESGESGESCESAAVTKAVTVARAGSSRGASENGARSAAARGPEARSRSRPPVTATVTAPAARKAGADGFPRLVHFAAKPLRRLWSESQTVYSGFKPRGLWLSVEGNGDGWRDWCLAENFGLGRLAVAHEVTLRADAAVLWLRSAEELDAFTARFVEPEGPRPYPMHAVRWREVAATHQGILISPYISERRLWRGCDWYYGWDCASACIWDAEAIETVAQVEPSQLPSSLAHAADREAS